MSSLITAVSKATKFVLVMKIKHKKRLIAMMAVYMLSLLCLMVRRCTTLSIKCCHFLTVSTVECFSYLNIRLVVTRSTIFPQQILPNSTVQFVNSTNTECEYRYCYYKCVCMCVIQAGVESVCVCVYDTGWC